MKKLKVLSLFDGISGARQALKELDIDCDYYASEIDKYAIQIAKANHPDIKQIGDVKTCLTMLRGYAEKYDLTNSFDLMVGGFPCQSFSIAGNRKGLEDDRGQLFFDLLRILGEVKPKYFLFENVASMSKANQAFISEKLGVEPIKINSALLTAQQRKRLYWTNIPNIEQPEDKGIVLKDIIENGVVDREKSHAIISSIGRTTDREYFKKNQGQLVFVDRDKSYCIDANYHKGGNLKSYFEKRRRQLVFNKDGLQYRKLTITECERLQGFPDGYCSMVSKTQGYKALGNSFTVPVIKHILKNIK